MMALHVKGKTLEYRDNVDAALVFANIVGYAAENNYRIRWSTAMSNEIPWYVHEVPTVFTTISQHTYMMQQWSKPISTRTIQIKQH